MINGMFASTKRCFVILTLTVLGLVQWTPGQCNSCNKMSTFIMCYNADRDFLTNLPPENVQVVSIVKSNLAYVSQKDFSKFTNVSEILIDNSEIPRRVLNYALSPQNLKVLLITNSHLPGNYFTALEASSSLVTLSLKGNKLFSIRNIDRLSRLEELYLNNNNISYIKEDMFRGLSALRKVDTSYNMLERVGMRVFDDLPSLEEIDLSHNKITTIEADAFRGLSALRRLDLSHNALSGDFDMASLSLPAGCVFQGLVASCPGQPMGGDPPGEGQRPAQEATTDDPQQQKQTEQREEQQQRQIERQEWKEVKEMLEQQQGAVRLLVEEVQRQRKELEQREHQRQAERQEWKEVKEMLEQQQGAVRLLVEEVQGQRKEQQQREQQRRAERQEWKEVKELLTERLRRDNANEGHALSAAFGRDLWGVNLVNVLNFLLLLILLILVCLLVTSQEQVQAQRDEEKPLRSWNR